MILKKELNLFIESLPNVKNYEIGTKSNFDFNHFFAKFIQQILSNNTLINTSHIEQIMEKIEEQQSFSKAPKFEKPKENSSPGPAKYLNNVYDTENIKERINALTGNNRFNTKLFINKKGPQLHEEKLKKPKNPILFLSKWLNRESLTNDLHQKYQDTKTKRENLEIKYYQQEKKKVKIFLMRNI